MKRRAVLLLPLAAAACSTLDSLFSDSKEPLPGKREEVALAPGEGNSLTGKLAAAPAGKVTSVLALTIDGKPAQVRFAPR